MMNFLKSVIAISSITLVVLSCKENTPKDIALGKDKCDNCMMTINDQKYAAELITANGRIYKFDDIICMEDYASYNPEKTTDAKTYVADYPSGAFINSTDATFISGGNIRSPMNGNTQAYKNKADAEEAAKKFGAEIKK